MLVSRTPLRFSLFSGGSDMASFYNVAGLGAALSVTINKYVYVITHRTPFPGVKTLYPHISEEVDTLDEMRHAITRETLKYHMIENSVTVASISDVPSLGTGLGSSSAFTVGLLNNLDYASRMTDRDTDLYWREWLAKKACQMEIEKCGYPIGKQDAYAAALGGFNLFKFHRDDMVDVEMLYLSEDTLMKFQDRLMLFYSGRGRSANAILARQREAVKDKIKFALIERNRDRAMVSKALLQEGRIDEIGAMLHESWLDKKQIDDAISDDYLDDIYETAMRHGALGGKVLGAGGGGFLLFYVEPDHQGRVASAINGRHSKCQHYAFRFVFGGTQICANC